jgi:hypothetical protein
MTKTELRLPLPAPPPARVAAARGHTPVVSTSCNKQKNQQLQHKNDPPLLSASQARPGRPPPLTCVNMTTNLVASPRGSEVEASLVPSGSGSGGLAQQQQQ